MSMSSIKDRWALAVLALATIAVPVSSCRAQPLSPYAEFQSMTSQELATLQVKLTFMGSSNRGIASVLFTATGGTPDVSLFGPFHRPNLPYFYDEFGPSTFTASVQLLKAMIDSVGTLPDVVDGGIDSAGTVSFSMLNTAGDTTRVFESIVNAASGRGLFGKMIAALAQNATATRSLRNFGCAVDMLPTTTPTEITSMVQLRASGLRADRDAAGQFVTTVRVTNISSTTISAPIILAVIIHADATLASAEGQTCRLAQPGHPFITIKLTGALLPGAHVERALRFINPTESKLNPEYRLFAGPGTP